ncbi:MAG: trypsin-like peptidase domain-containing protein [Candidatus Curtissbacteria bacterium]|nr:trypsin-like peptidase domain-containing protein [Candidatus Curtissbacteria bacterium]
MFNQFKIKALTIVLVVVALWIISVVAVLQMLGKLPEGSTVVDRLTEKQRVVDEESVVIDVVERVSPSVVSIAVENRQIFDPFGSSQGSQESGIGTGFVVSKDGLILTNKHVVSNSGEKYIAILKGADGSEKKYEVKKVNLDPFNDLALVRIDASDLTPMELGDSDHLKVGQKVIAIGNALGRFQNTVTTGVVSGLGRGVSPVDPTTGIAERLDDLVQTDAAINPGNSGGPLVNTGGQVIAINSAVASAENIGFAIKINIAKQLIDDFQKSGGKISRPQLGVRYTHVSRDVAILNEVPEGEYVREVVKGSGANSAGVKVGDIITQLDEQKLTEENSLVQIIRGKKVGETIKIRVWRDGKTIDMTALLGEAVTE